KRAEGKVTSVERWEDVGDSKKIITWAQGYYEEKA
ncbi:inorganic pyrophosphatase, partial [Candidatus Bathyarchaeota archaeon]|nr:inorganic pyrophosphatase [Candidatus Bathyarchaeota archaeon]